MLIAKIDREKVHVQLSGDLDEIVVEVSLMVGGAYAQIATADQGAAEEFRRKITAMLVVPDTPVWQMDPAAGGIACVVPVSEEEEQDVLS